MLCLSYGKLPLTITVTSWARWRLKSLASPLFAHQFVQAHIKISDLRVTGLCVGNPRVTGGIPHKRPVTPNMFPFDGVIMVIREEFWRLLTMPRLSTSCDKMNNSFVRYPDFARVPVFYMLCLFLTSKLISYIVAKLRYRNFSWSWMHSN